MVLEGHRDDTGQGEELYTHACPHPPLVSRFVLLQVNVKRPMKDETHFELVESGRYIILLLGKALSVVWDHHLGISVVLKQTYQASGLPPLPPRLVCDLSLGPSSASSVTGSRHWLSCCLREGGWLFRRASLPYK